MAKSARRYLVPAVLVVLFITGFLTSNPKIAFSILNPGKTLERMQYQEKIQLGNRETPLSLAEANELYAIYRKDWNSGADRALIGQHAKNGLPQTFVAQIEREFLTAGPQDNRHAHSLLSRMVRHEPPSLEVEKHAKVAMLAEIANHRPLANDTVKRLIETADNSSDGPAHEAIITMAEKHGLPAWAVDDLERIAKERRGSVRSKAIEAIAATGEYARAQHLVDNLADHPLAPESVASTLAATPPLALIDIVRDESRSMGLRVGAFKQLAREREHPELVGATYTFALLADGPLAEAAYQTYSESGRHYSRHIDVDWPTLVARHFDGPESLRARLGLAYRHLPMGTPEEDEAFLQNMLNGSDNQQHSALRALFSLPELSEDTVTRIASLQLSPNPEVKKLASTHMSRLKRKSPLAKIQNSLMYTFFWAAFSAVFLAALGWQIWFVARWMSSVSGASHRAVHTIVTLTWFGGSLTLGFGLFVFLIGYGHGGGGVRMDSVALLGLTASIVWVLGWGINRMLNRAETAP